MDDRIHRELAAIEREEDVRILYACESGSRAWGFASPDSDYDPRFFYAHRPEWYLVIDRTRHRDVIERPVTGDLDISGWDLPKTLQLYRKSNPPLLEWLHSPIVYIDRYGFADRLRALLPEYYSPAACRYHYLHMASGNYRKYLDRDTVEWKKYFYVLRPLFAVRWIDEGRGIAPMEFPPLVEKTVRDPELKRAIGDLLRRKRSGEELARGPHIPEIMAFIRSEMERLEGWDQEYSAPPRDAGKLNDLFREMLRRAWEEEPEESFSGVLPQD